MNESHDKDAGPSVHKTAKVEYHQEGCESMKSSVVCPFQFIHSTISRQISLSFLIESLDPMSVALVQH